MEGDVAGSPRLISLSNLLLAIIFFTYVGTQVVVRKSERMVEVVCQRISF